MYCKRCDRDDVGVFHRCFMPGFNQIRPLKHKPNPNTTLARKLAKLYEECFGIPFPGGITNARVARDQLAINCYRDAGSWVWSLAPIDINCGVYYDFGSPSPAKECLKYRQYIRRDNDEDAFPA